MANKPDRSPALEAFGRLLDIMDDLRAQCPWDKVQTEQTLRILTIEETYELADAIDAGDWPELGKELGDLFLHLVFYCKIASEQGHFDVADVLHGVCDKLVRRHPHIYGDVHADDADAVKANWEAIKLAEKSGKPERQSVLDGVPKALPALVKSYRITRRTAHRSKRSGGRRRVWRPALCFGELRPPPRLGPRAILGAGQRQVPEAVQSHGGPAGRPRRTQRQTKPRGLGCPLESGKTERELIWA
jgi:XTP/dITP diphosphohydrolase